MSLTLENKGIAPLTVYAATLARTCTSQHRIMVTPKLSKLNKKKYMQLALSYLLSWLYIYILFNRHYMTHLFLKFLYPVKNKSIYIYIQKLVNYIEQLTISIRHLNIIYKIWNI